MKLDNKRRGVNAIAVVFVLIVSVFVAIALQITGAGGRQVPNTPIAFLFIGGLIAAMVLIIVVIIKSRT